MTRGLLAWLVGAALVACLPLAVHDSFFLHVCILVLMWTALGAAWNVLGGFYAFYFRYVDPDAVLNIALSMEMVFIAMVGGLGTTGGPLLGAVFLTTVGETVRERFQVGHLVFYGLFMMLVIRYMPDGIWGRARRWIAAAGARLVDHGAA